jgi:uncharacterized protein with PQ loop repeat
VNLELHNHLIDKAAVVNGVISGLALYPQVWKIFVTSDVSGISFVTFFLIATNSLVWILYAMHRGLIALGLASLLNFTASVAMVTALWWFL